MARLKNRYVISVLKNTVGTNTLLEFLQSRKLRDGLHIIDPVLFVAGLGPSFLRSAR